MRVIQEPAAFTSVQVQRFGQSFRWKYPYYLAQPDSLECNVV